MWNDEDNKLDDILMEINNDLKFPSLCSSCSKNDVHFYMTRFDDSDEHGSGWIWCSSCQNYSHFQYKIPSWWENCPSIDIDYLETEPDYLETKKEIIDDWVNTIFNRRSKVD